MKQKISTLMDGELCSDEAEALLAKFKNHPESRQEWSTYHLIGDALRQPDYVSDDISSAIIKRLHAEPTVLAPQGKSLSRASYFAMSAVATIMAVVFLAWMSVQTSVEQSYQQARQKSGGTRTDSVSASEGMNDYLLAHQEFSPGSDVRGAASYIRTVAYKQSVAGK